MDATGAVVADVPQGETVGDSGRGGGGGKEAAAAAAATTTAVRLAVGSVPSHGAQCSAEVGLAKEQLTKQTAHPPAPFF